MPDEEKTFPKRNRIEKPSELKRIKIAEINPGSRIRVDKGTKEEWREFLDSLTERGQISPITVMDYGEPFSGFQYYLLAGGRRLAALKELNQEEVDAKIYPSDLNSDEQVAIELRENLDRKNLTPEEISAGINKFHNACIALYGAKKGSTAPGAKGHSLRDTAKLLGKSVGLVSKALQANKVFEAVPELGKVAKTWSDVNRLVNEAERRVKVKEIKEKIDQEKKDTPALKIQQLVSEFYILKDVRKAVTELKPNSVDLIEFDPDYPIKDDARIIQGLKAKDMKTQGIYHKVDRKEFLSFCSEILQGAFKALKPTGWLLLWFGYEYFSEVQEIAKKAGFNASFVHGKWYKGKGFAHSSNPYDTLGHTIEPFFYLKKSSKARLINPHSDSFEHSPVHHTKKNNPYEKPIPLYDELLQTFVHQKSYIVSLCCGSGNILLAAANHSCVAKGFDLSKEQRDFFKVKTFEAYPPNYGKAE